jgi:hypothetical protein
MQEINRLDEPYSVITVILRPPHLEEQAAKPGEVCGGWS